MRAIVYDGRLRYTEDHPEPEPAAGECLVDVRAAGICATDHHITRGYMDFAGVLGHEMVGTVASGSAQWRGKRVACEINCVCRRCDMCQAGLATHCRHRTVIGIVGRDGCFAERVAVPERNLHVIPGHVTDEEAVFVEPLAAAYQIIKQVPIEARSNVSVVGSGRLGLLVAQVLARTGCHLQVVGRNPNTLTFCEKRRIQSVSTADLIPRNDRDIVVECSGSLTGMDIALSLVRPRGTVVLKSTHAGREPTNLAPIVVNEVTVVGSRCGPFADAIDALSRRDIDVSPMISRTFSLDRAADAFDASQDPGNIKILFKIGG